MSGHIDTAIEQTEMKYPQLLDTHPDLMFKLKTRKFLEIMIHEDDDDTSSIYSAGRKSSVDASSVHSGRRKSSIDTSSVYSSGRRSSIVLEDPPVRASGRRLSWAAVAASPSETEETGKRRLFSFSSGRSHAGEDTHKLDILRKAVEYGQVLQDEYQDTPKYMDQLMDMFGLLSFTDPKSSPLAHMLDISLRDVVASDLNNAIQEYEHHNGASNLESLYKQCVASNKELALTGHGKSSLVPVQDFF